MLRNLTSLVKIEHTLFALPLALTGAILAERGLPGLTVLGLLALAFTAARTSAMAFNRLADRDVDSLNPRTANREIPSGTVSLPAAGALIAVSVLVFFFVSLGT
jgi:4-hydroxybenzoate polyprenyltransferase